MIDPIYYPDIEDADTLKLYIDGALQLVGEALHFTGPEKAFRKVNRELYGAKLDIEEALSELKQVEGGEQ